MIPMTSCVLAAALAAAALAFQPATSDAQGRVRGLVRLGGEYGGDKVAEFQYSDGSSPAVTAGGGVMLALGGAATLFSRDAHAVEAQASLGVKYRTIPPATNQDATWLRFPVEGLLFYRLPAGVRLGGGATVHLNNTLEASGEASNDRVEFKSSPGFIVQADYGRGSSVFDLRYTMLEYEIVGSSGGKIGASSVGVGFTYFFGR